MPTRQEKNRQRILDIQEKKDRKERLRIAKEAVRIQEDMLKLHRKMSKKTTRF